jgi:hypothetical protein
VTVVMRGVVEVLDRHGVVGEAGAWVAEQVALILDTEGYSVIQHPSEAGAEPFAHVEGVPLDEAEFIYRALVRSR